jgi:hypothetical protein
LATACLLLTMILPVHPAQGQGMGGLLVGDRFGIDRSQVNPASLSMTQNYLAFTLLGAHLFAQTNMAYVPRSEFSYGELLDLGNQLLSPPLEQQFPLDFFRRQPGIDEKHLYLQARIAGPAIMLSLDRHSFALGQVLRMNTSFERMPHDIAHTIFEGSPPEPDRAYRHETPISATSMSWAEWFVSYSAMLWDDHRHQLSGGATLKWLRGIHGFYLRSEVAEYEDRGGTANRINQFRGEAGMSLPLDYQTSRFLFGDQVFLASGYGVDIGLLYARPLNRRRPIARAGRAYRSSRRLCDTEYTPYKFRVGLSVTDLGAIFFDQNIRHLAFDDVSSLFGSEFNTGTGEGIDGLIDETARYFSVGRDDLVTNQEFQIGLPAAVNLQIDYLLAPRWYLHAMAMHPIPRTGITIQQSAYLSVIPRFENDWIALSAPLSVYAKGFVRAGLALRIWNLTVGVDSLRSSLGLSDFRGAGFYFSLQFGLQKGNCRRDRRWMPDCTIYN